MWVCTEKVLILETHHTRQKQGVLASIAAECLGIFILWGGQNLMKARLGDMYFIHIQK